MTIPTDMASFAHDIKNILAPALLSAEHLAAIDPVRSKRYTDRIFKAIDKTVEICNSAMSAPDQSAATVSDGVSISEVLNDAVELAVLQRKPRLAISPRLIGDDFVCIDGNILCRMIFNLVRNASTAMKDQADAHISIAATARNGLLKIDIRDNGPGIPVHILDQLFPKLSTDVTRTGRIGLGLATTAQMAATLGGELLLRSTSSRGTAFTIVVPYATHAMSAQNLSQALQAG